MSAIARTDTSLVGRWWWTIDRWLRRDLASQIRRLFAVEVAPLPLPA